MAVAVGSRRLLVEVDSGGVRREVSCRTAADWLASSRATWPLRNAFLHREIYCNAINDWLTVDLDEIEPPHRAERPPGCV